jgi:glycosyltransferase involved in cell wall biosynthesis
MASSLGVVIPLHNKRHYVRRAVESVLRQVHTDWQLTVVDDGSTDGGDRLVEQISDARVALIRTPCRGPGAARNLGIAATEADWIGLLDADDEWHPTFLERTAAAARSGSGLVAVFTGIEVQGAPARRSTASVPAAGALIEDYFAARMRFDIAISSSSILLKKSAFLSAGGFREDSRYAEDIEAWFRLSCEGPMFYIPQALSAIELHHAGGITRSIDPIERAAGLQMLLDSYERYRQAGRIPAQRSASCRRFMQQQRGRMALHLFSAGQRAAGARLLLSGVPFARHTWREYARCALLVFTAPRSSAAACHPPDTPVGR